MVFSLCQVLTELDLEVLVVQVVSLEAVEAEQGNQSFHVVHGVMVTMLEVGDGKVEQVEIVFVDHLEQMLHLVDPAEQVQLQKQMGLYRMHRHRNGYMMIVSRMEEVEQNLHVTEVNELEEEQAKELPRLEKVITD